MVHCWWPKDSCVEVEVVVVSSDDVGIADSDASEPETLPLPGGVKEGDVDAIEVVLLSI